jgi:hypothetical protein
MTFLHSVFALAVESQWAPGNPVARAARLRRRREGDADPDLQFLTLPSSTPAIAAISDRTVDRDALGPVLRLVILAAATSDAPEQHGPRILAAIGLTIRSCRTPRARPRAASGVVR